MIENSLADEFKIIPNPSSEYLRVEYDNQNIYEIKFEIHSINGELMMSGKLTEDHFINLKGLRTGTYILKLKESDAWFTQKIVKE